MRTLRMTHLAAAGALAAIGVAACDKAPGGGSTAAGGPIAVTATDTECKIGSTSVAAGTVSFKVTNQGTKVTEFYVYAPGDRVMGEVENIGPGLSRDVHMELPAGSYETACKPGMVGKGIRGAFTTTGSHEALTDDAKLAQATESYQRYVKSQTDTLLVKTQEFVDAVKANDVAK